MEIEIRGIHITCIFLENRTTGDIEHFLSLLRVDPSQRGDEKANCVAGIDEVRRLVSEQGGPIVAAHCNSSKGLFTISGKDFDDIYNIIDVFEVNKGDLQRNIGALSRKRADIADRAFVQSSDAHQKSDLGRNNFSLRMDAPNLHSLKQLIFEIDLDWQNRIRGTK